MSPPHRLKLFKTKKKQESQVTEYANNTEKIKSFDIENILSQTLCKNTQEKMRTFRRGIKEKLKKEARKEKIKRKNEKIRMKNSKFIKLEMKHPKPWGSDQRSLKDSGKNSDNDEIRKKIRNEREIMKKEGRKAIGLDYYTNVRVKKNDKKLNFDDI